MDHLINRSLHTQLRAHSVCDAYSLDVLSTDLGVRCDVRTATAQEAQRIEAGTALRNRQDRKQQQ